MTKSLAERFRKARALSWENHGKEITFYLPGMFTFNGLAGRYPGLSITGKHCDLQCDHCRGLLLRHMIPAETPAALAERCLQLAARGNQGVLISGGCDDRGRLPWNAFLPAIRDVRAQTDLYISVHCGLLDDRTARELKIAGVDQALIDVIGDDTTYRRVCHVPFGVSAIERSLDSLNRSTIPVVPHIVCGLDYGRMGGERAALERIARFHVEQVVVVSLMPARGTPMWGVETPTAEAVAEIIADARLRLPETKIALGCARERGNTRMDRLAVDAGVNRMALPSEEAVERAKDYGLKIRYQRTCCSVSRDFSADTWTGSLP
jgi:uncharacterized radical SAM superfamily protein